MKELALPPQINQIENTDKYLQYKYDYDSQTNSVFAHNCKEWNRLYHNHFNFYNE